MSSRQKDFSGNQEIQRRYNSCSLREQTFSSLIQSTGNRIYKSRKNKIVSLRIRILDSLGACTGMRRQFISLSRLQLASWKFIRFIPRSLSVVRTKEYSTALGNELALFLSQIESDQFCDEGIIQSRLLLH